MRPSIRRAVCLGAVLGLSAVPLVASAQEKATLSGGDVAIYNLVGSIKAVGGGSGDVSVSIAKSGKDAAQLRVEQGTVRGKQTLRVIYPARRITFGDDRGWGSRTTLRVADDGTFDDNNDEGSRVEISGRSGGLEARADLTVTVPTGKAIHLHLAAGDVTVTNVNGDVSVGVDAADVTTSGTKGALTLDTGSGTVEITDAQGDVNIDCGSGPVTLSKIRGSRLSVDAGSGRMRGDGIDAKRIDLDLGSGGATLKNVTTTDLKLDSGSGATEIDLTSDVDRVDIDSGSGAITLWIPPTLGAKIDIDAGSGGIDMGVPVSVTRYESDHVVGTIGDGQGTIRIDAGSGGVHLRKRG
jgi:lia operon protein LiaG